jgi:hypothetical protein
MKPLIFILSVILLTGCHRYYMPVNNTSPSAASIKKFMEEDRIFILRDSGNAYEMRNVKLDGEEIICDLQKLTGLKIQYKPTGKNQLSLTSLHGLKARSKNRYIFL